MSTLPALLRACKEAPEEDVPRLVLADWLDEHGEADRAELVRLQCRLDGMPDSDPDHAALWARAATLLRERAAGWLGPLAGRYEDVSFRWGLIHVTASTDRLRDAPLGALPEAVRVWVEGLSVTPGEKVPLGNLLTRDALATVTSLDATALGWGGKDLLVLNHQATAHLRRLGLRVAYTRAPDFAGLMQASWPALRSLTLSVGGQDVGVGAGLAKAPWLGGLRELAVRWVDLRPEDLGALVSARPAALERLSLPGCKLTDEAMAHLAGLADLTRLNLTWNDLTGKGVEALVRAPWQRLEALDLSANKLGAVGARALAGSPWPGRLRDLDLGHCGVTAAGLGQLLERGRPANLRRLILSRNRVGDAGANLLAAADCLAGLDTLHLASAGLTAAGVAELARSRSLRSLRSLDLGGNSLGTEGLEALGAADGLPALAGLELSQVAGTPEGLAALARSPLLDRLRRLNLDCNHQRPEALRPLLRSPRLGRLLDLHLGRNALGEEGLRELAASPLWGRLVQLDLSRAELKDGALRVLAALPAPAALVSLNLNHNPFRQGEPLVGWAHRPRLLRLGLERSSLRPEQAEALLVGPGWGD